MMLMDKTLRVLDLMTIEYPTDLEGRLSLSNHMEFKTLVRNAQLGERV